MGYAGFIGFASNCVAELWVISEGLKVPIALDISRLIVESDSLVVVTLLQQNIEDTHPLATLVKHCKYLWNRDWDVHLKHTLREV
ncbi:hypothetical protein Scep_016422 [Stephania cephalantha]|uniref:RNase H type-1 domain-containing protein n=1 Tax=Stephania cephalantha TaxID=152367 RepID=A0AAP0NU58_9MAGN